MDWLLARDAAVAIAAAMLALWALSLRLRDASIVDIFWGLGFVGIAWLGFTRSAVLAPRPVVVVALVTAWGLRLALHIARRNLGKPEDPRYRAMRESWGHRWTWVSLFQVFGLQGVLLLLISLPVQVALSRPAPPSPTALDGLGALVAVIGIVFEAVGDGQLARFKGEAAHRGQVMTQGLWRYTRHPNYFGDFCVWWGLYLIAAGAGGVFTIVSPLVMSFLLMRVSGVPMLERSMVSRPGYADYMRRTSAFFPRPPRSDSPPG